MSTAHEARPRIWLVLGLLIAGVCARLLPHPENLAPVAAIALFGGTYLPAPWSMILPVAVIGLSDLSIGLHDTIAFTWGSVALVSLLGWWVRRRPGAPRIAAASLAGSVLFFLITNFGVWLLGDGGQMYPKTAAGLWQCYLAALPFFRNTLLGDLVFAAAIFGAYELADRRLPAPHGAR